MPAGRKRLSSSSIARCAEKLCNLLDLPVTSGSLWRNCWKSWYRSRLYSHNQNIGGLYIFYLKSITWDFPDSVACVFCMGQSATCASRWSKLQLTFYCNIVFYLYIIIHFAYFRRKMTQLCLWTKIRTKQWPVLVASAFQCMRAGFLCPKCDNFTCLHNIRQDPNELHLKRWFFYAKIGICCKSICRNISQCCPSVYTIIFVRPRDKTNYLSNQTWASCYHSRNKH